jgi:catechol 2,3-dioxygenase-like lactoylglutathione lyase family enzyme
MAVTSLHHISLRVQDPEVSRAFFTALGFSSTDIPVPPEMSRTWRGAPDSGVLVAFPAGGTFLVLEPPLAGTAADDSFDEHRIGVDHIAVNVDSRGDLQGLVDRLGALGVATAGIELDPVLGHEYVCFRDPDNVQWEFYQG